LKIKIFMTVLKGGYYILKMAGSLLKAWLTLGWKVRRARKSFEKQLIIGGMSKEDAKQLSGFYRVLKDQMLGTVKGAITESRKSSKMAIIRHQPDLHLHESENSTS
jgi:hypothetical protein